MQTFIRRLQALGILDQPVAIRNVLRQFQMRDERYEKIEFRIREEERPPMIEIPAYREKFGREA